MVRGNRCVIKPRLQRPRPRVWIPSPAPTPPALGGRPGHSNARNPSKPVGTGDRGAGWGWGPALAGPAGRTAGHERGGRGGWLKLLGLAEAEVRSAGPVPVFIYLQDPTSCTSAYARNPGCLPNRRFCTSPDPRSCTSTRPTHMYENPWISKTCFLAYQRFSKL